MKNKIKQTSIIKTTYTACFATLVFIGTQFVKIPLPFGYFHIGDPFVILAGYFVGGGYTAIAAAIGSVLADILSGYAVYAPATLIIKTFMVFIVSAFFHSKQKTHKQKFLWLAIRIALAEAVMILGYYLYDSLLYGFLAAAVSLPGNLLQGMTATVLSVITIMFLEKSNILQQYKLF